MIKNIAIIGAGGDMGYWFSKYFNKKHKVLSLYDIRPVSQKPPSNAVIYNNIEDCVKKADLVLVCVPVKNTPQIIEECASKMKLGAILAEISSVKRRSFEALKKIRTGIIPLCIHPMFGPGKMNLKQMKILMIPVSNEQNELKISNKIFDESLITVIRNSNVHDRLIAIVLGLTHFMNIIFANFLSKQDLSYLNEIAGTSFEMQSLLMTSILTEQPSLIVDLLIENRSAKLYIQSYLREAKKVAKLVFDGNSVDLGINYEKTKKTLQGELNLQLSYKRMYDILEKVK
ncbi:MAG TPA: prephenate dehydrogenase [Nitrososphaeraceae archaeon]|nr:prephenate dehydrogenase [Nitrososphaeraceae archaeon]